MSVCNYKVTYHLGSTKRSMILHQEYEGGFKILFMYIHKLLFKDLGYPERRIRLYWIDNAGDEIEILCDQDIKCLKEFPNSNSLYPHIHVDNVEEDSTDKTSKSKSTAEPTSTNSTSQQTKVPPADGSYEFAVHDYVECDSCLMVPIVGFRYKCIQCPNYDLCQNCESKHVHSEHMMVRMPTNNCPSVVETYITGRSSARKHGKRSRTTCPLIKNGLSVISDDNMGENTNAGGDGENAEQQSTPLNGKERHHGRRHHRRHQRNNFLAHLYEMMHDLAEGGGAAAAAHATGDGEEASSSTKTTTTTTSSGPHTATTNNNETEPNIIAAQIATQQAHESAVKVAEIASKVAHEAAVQVAKNVTTNLFAKKAVDTNDTNGEESTKDKVDATTSPRDNSNTVPVVPSPSLETLAQFLDPQYMKTGIQILNNFSDMFAKMLDPMDTEDASNIKSAAASTSSINTTNLRKNSTTSSKSSSVSSNLNSMNEKEKSVEKQQNNEETNKEDKKTESDVSPIIEIEDIGSDSETDSVSESFIKVYAPKEANTTTKTTTANNSAETTPPKTLDFAQLSANLLAHIAEEDAKKAASTSIETGVAVTEQVTKTTSTATAATTVGEPVVVATTSATTTTTAANEERRAVPVYHADKHINNAVHAMMAMGFSNEGAWLTQLLESVNGNIPDALDLMSVAQRGGGR